MYGFKRLRQSGLNGVRDMLGDGAWADGPTTAYSPVDEKIREKIRHAIPDNSCFKGKPSRWWASRVWMPEHLINRKTVEAFPVPAGIETFRNQPLVDWLADEFTKIRKSVQEVPIFR